MHERHQAGAVAATGALHALPAVLALALVWLTVTRDAEPAYDHALTGPALLPELCTGWSGAEEFEPGRLSARLAPLHADPSRQGFDAATLATRLGLGPGEPWMLALRWTRERGPNGDNPRWIELGDVLVEDERGPALAVLPRPAADGDRIASPVEILLAPPREVLEPGSEVEFVLWGPMPAGKLRLCTGAGDLTLEPCSFGSAELPSTIARAPDRAQLRAPLRTPAASEAGREGPR